MRQNSDTGFVIDTKGILPRSAPTSRAILGPEYGQESNASDAASLGRPMVDERRTKSGELWSDLNKRRGRLAAQARRNMAQLRRQIDREQRARTLAQGAADKRIRDVIWRSL